jgi:hypothetical protein
VGEPTAVAIPSSSVDFPEPFSPAKSVTGLSKRSSRSDLTAGTENGNAAP